MMPCYRVFSCTALLAIFVWVTSAFAQQTDGDTVPLPVFPDGPIALKVAFLETPHFPTFTEAEWEQFLTIAERTAKEHFGVEIEFISRDHLSLSDVFRRIDAAMPQDHKDQIADFRNGNIDWARMERTIRDTMRGYEEYVSNAHSMVLDVEGADFPALRGTTPEEQADGFATDMAVLLREKMAIFRNALGVEFLGGDDREGLPGYNEWVYWDSLPALDLDYDVYLTNQPMISVEYSSYPAHVILRGGVTVGTTSPGEKTQFGSATALSIHSFLDSSEAFVALRGGHTYTREEAIRLSGKYFTHELGHMLFHFGHPWRRPECVMKPSNLLKFHEWENGLDASICTPGSGPAMEPGAVTIPVQVFSES